MDKAAKAGRARAAQTLAERVAFPAINTTATQIFNDLPQLEQPPTKRLPQATLRQYIYRVAVGMGLPENLTTKQKATLARLLQDEDSLLRMWCDGRFEAWEQATMAKKPPILISGVLADPEITMGMDWELPFAVEIDGSGYRAGAFSEAFMDKLERRGFTAYEGEYNHRIGKLCKDKPAQPRYLFCYDDNESLEYGGMVTTDNPKGWEYYEGLFGALNDMNLALYENDVRRRPKLSFGCVEELLAPVPNPNPYGERKLRYTSGWHIHLRHPKLDWVAGGLHKNKSMRILVGNVLAAARMAELPMYRLGQHKRFGWRKSAYVKPYSRLGINTLQEVRHAFYTGPVEVNDSIKTFEFRPNDTYVDTGDPGATFRRFQAQAAFYSGILHVGVNYSRESDFSILGEGNGQGLDVGFAAGEGPEREVEKVHFLAALDLFTYRTAKTKTGKDYDLRRLVYYEWRTSKPVEHEANT